MGKKIVVKKCFRIFRKPPKPMYFKVLKPKLLKSG